MGVLNLVVSSYRSGAETADIFLKFLCVPCALSAAGGE